MGESPSRPRPRGANVRVDPLRGMEGRIVARLFRRFSGPRGSDQKHMAEDYPPRRRKSTHARRNRRRGAEEDAQSTPRQRPRNPPHRGERSRCRGRGNVRRVEPWRDTRPGLVIRGSKPVSVSVGSEDNGGRPSGREPKLPSRVRSGTGDLVPTQRKPTEWKSDVEELRSRGAGPAAGHNIPQESKDL